MDPAKANSDALRELAARGQAAFTGQAFSALLGARLVRFDRDMTQIELPIRPDLLQQHGFVHGGVLSYLADNVLTFAGGAHLDGDIVTAEIKVNYVRSAFGSLLIARGSTVSAGRSQAVARCEIYAVQDGTETLCAVGQGTIATRPGK